MDIGIKEMVENLGNSTGAFADATGKGGDHTLSGDCAAVVQVFNSLNQGVAVAKQDRIGQGI